MLHASDTLDWKVMSPMFVVVIIDAISLGIILPLLPFYAYHFGATPIVIGMLVAVFSLCQFITAPVLGRLSDKYGRKPVLMGSQLGTLFSLILLASAWTLPLVFLARMLDGFTAGKISVASAYVVDRSSPAVRKQALGLVGASISVGIMIGPAISALLSPYSMSAPIWGAAGLCLVSVVMTSILVPKDTPTHQGAARASMSLKQLRQMPNTLRVLSVLAVFNIAFSLFISQVPLFMVGQLTWNDLPIGPQHVGMAFMASGAVNIVTQLFAMRWISRHFSDDRLAIISLGLLTCGYLGVGYATNIGIFGVAFLIAALGTAMTRPAMMSALSMTVERQQQGAIMGVSTSLMALANIVAPLLGGLLIEHQLYQGWGYTTAAVAGIGLMLVTYWVVQKRWPHMTPAS